MAHLRALVAFPSVSSAPNRDLVAWLADRLEDAGARVEVLAAPCGAKANLWASFGPDAPGGLVLSGHTDVVPVEGQDWTRPPFALTEEDGRLYGRGTCDMKGFVAACLAAVADGGAARRRTPLHLAFTYDEEVGCLGGRALTADLAARGIRPGLVVVGEPTGMAVVDGHKGCCEYTVRFTGLAGHGSDPGAGANAVEAAARYAARLIALRPRLAAAAPADERFQPPWTTLNVGALHGGAAHNVIAEEARLDWEMRPVRAADADLVRTEMAACAAELLAEMHSIHPGAAIETEVVGEVAGLDPRPANAARDLLCGLTGQNGAGTVPFGTEAGLYQALGADVAVCGPGHIAQAHTADEYLAVDQLGACCTLLRRLVAAA
ncbi:acetylornithine deacetylase [Rhodobacteraceae bacterium CCMM004]|nr:acetylornithine deacetylase [Rhodobacteraceae bacterium CCMM004]